MSIQRVISPQVPEPAGAAYSGALRVGNQLFLSGMTASAPDGTTQAPGDMLGQARVCLAKIRHMVEAAGGTMADVVKITIYVTDIAQRPAVNQARQECFGAPYPCSTFLEVKGFVSPDLLVEIDAHALIGASAGG